MVNPEMFGSAFSAVPKPVAKAPVVQNNAPEDPQIAKMRAALLRILTYLVAGGAILLIAWRIILKFI